MKKITENSPCSRCQTNPRMSFPSRKLFAYCQTCHNEISRAWIVANPEKYAAQKAKAKAKRDAQPKKIKPQYTPAQQTVIDALKFVRENPNHQECIEWQRGKNNGGYGNVYWMDGRTYSVSRITLKLYYEWAGFEFKDTLDCLHSCDNPTCHNINHLSLGTARENVRQAMERNRFPQAYSPKYYLRLCSDEDVKKMRQLSADGYSGVEIANMFKIPYVRCQKILTNKTYRNLL